MLCGLVELQLDPMEAIVTAEHRREDQAHLTAADRQAAKQLLNSTMHMYDLQGSNMMRGMNQQAAVWLPCPSACH